ncbi:MAG: GtrA family protein [Christensenellaceae bacterium]|jgi:putative flippase GtrA
MEKKQALKEGVLYLIFGVLTTLISYITFWLALQVLGAKLSLIANTFSFICACVFAFVTNKLYVFNSRSWHMDVLKKELPSFLMARIFSFFFEQLGLLFFTVVVGISEKTFFGIEGLMVAKIGLSIVVVILNYIISKFFIFKKEQPQNE